MTTHPTFVAFFALAATCLSCSAARGFDADPPLIEFRIAEAEAAPGLARAEAPGQPNVIYLQPKVIVSRAGIAQLRAARDDRGLPVLDIVFNEQGRKSMAQATGDNVGKRLAVVVDGKVLVAPVIRDKIEAQAQLTGNFTAAEIQRLVDRMQVAKAKTP